MARAGHTAFVFARGGSKGVPRKNLRLAGGKPLIAHAIECGLASRHVGRVVVSTDDEEIASVAREHGAETPFLRPAELAKDDAPELLAWRHAITSTPGYAADGLFISLPATAPLRSPKDVDRAVEQFDRGGFDLLLSVSPAHRNPYLNMVTIDASGMLKVVNESGGAFRRQDVPEVYDVTTCVYVARAEFIMRCERLMQGRTGAVIIPPERALDIDTEYDLFLADLLLRHPFGPKQ